MQVEKTFNKRLVPILYHHSHRCCV